MAKVRVFINCHDRRAPGACTVEIVNKKHLKCLLRGIRANGFPSDESTALIQNDVEEFEEQFKDLSKHGSGVYTMDAFEAGNLYGYDGNEILSRCVRGKK